jgi:hypothetical protein
LNPFANAVVVVAMVDVTRLDLEKDMFGVGFHNQLAIIQKKSCSFNQIIIPTRTCLHLKPRGKFNIKAFVTHKQ